MENLLIVVLQVIESVRIDINAFYQKNEFFFKPFYLLTKTTEAI
jgi:hypothetical protein